ncbi:MAG TPA: hypothetical protein VGO57_10195 [Verrucomicrobiae bacterium]|jgi:hypothetical protein
MNENDSSVLPPTPEANPNLNALPASDPPKPISWWLRRLFACNPFYLVSAALLLFGCYRVSIDAPLFNLETARLLFNFTAIQSYEILLVVTAIFLSRRAVWYDSTLLIGLENLLVFVPFILISLAALIDSHMALTVCVAGGIVATLRFGGLKHSFRRLNLPGRLLAIGFALLALNLVLPLLYRHFGENIIAAYVNSGPAHAMNLRVWMLAFPAVIALANFLPRFNKTGPLLPERGWLPWGLFSLWVIVTGIHLYSLGYIYQFDFCYLQTVPALWVLTWTICWQLHRNFPVLAIRIKYLLLLPPMLVALFAIAPQSGDATCLMLGVVNLIAYGYIWFQERDNSLARHLVFASLLMTMISLPMQWLHVVVPGLTWTEITIAGMVAYLVVWAALSRNPKLAIFGSVLLGCAVARLINHHPAGYWAFQSSFVFLLVHSLRWDDTKDRSANAVRILIGFVWILQSFAWAHSAAGQFWLTCIPGTVVLIIYLVVQRRRGDWQHLNVAIAATIVIFSGPAIAAVNSVQTMPTGLLAVIGSFLLFGFGTAAALTKNHWHKPDPATAGSHPMPDTANDAAGTKLSSPNG